MLKWCSKSKRNVGQILLGTVSLKLGDHFQMKCPHWDINLRKESKMRFVGYVVSLKQKTMEFRVIFKINWVLYISVSEME